MSAPIVENGADRFPFLAINGARLTASSSESEKFLLNFYATGTFDFTRLSRWLRENVAYDESE